MNKIEQAYIRNKLVLRQEIDKTWAIYTTIHGTHVYRWFTITDAQAVWYKQTFPKIKIVIEVETEAEINRKQQENLR